MPVAAFDTFKYAKKLKQAGFSEEQVEAQVGALAEALQSGFQELASKQDVVDVKQELKQDIAQVKQDITQVKQELKQDIAQVRQELAQVRQELKSDIKQLDTRLTGEMLLLKWMFGAICAALIGILIRLFFRGV